MLFAFSANFAIGRAKTAVALFTGSASMLPESAHSWALWAYLRLEFVGPRQLVLGAGGQPSS